MKVNAVRMRNEGNKSKGGRNDLAAFVQLLFVRLLLNIEGSLFKFAFLYELFNFSPFLTDSAQVHCSF